MIGLDTNILLRYLVRDDPLQSARAAEYIDRRLTERNAGFISTVVMAETAWVLKSVYAFADHEIAAAIERILQIESLVVEHAQEVFVAMTVAKQRRGSFADALIGAINAGASCSHTVTLDQKALRLPWFEPV